MPGSKLNWYKTIYKISQIQFVPIRLFLQVILATCFYNFFARKSYRGKSLNPANFVQGLRRNKNRCTLFLWPAFRIPTPTKGEYSPEKKKSRAVLGNFIGNLNRGWFNLPTFLDSLQAFLATIFFCLFSGGFSSSTEGENNMFHALSTTLRSMPMVAPPVFKPGQPRRKTLTRIQDNCTFVLPLKQSFIKDARIMPGTMRMLALIAGWSGRQDKSVIETTQSILGKHLDRSVRQVYRYLQDAMEEGYLLYSYTKNRWGYITGIKIWLNSLAIRKKTSAKKRKNGGNQARTQMSDTNEKLLLNRERDSDLWERLEQLANTAGFQMPSDHPS